MSLEDANKHLNDMIDKLSGKDEEPDAEQREEDAKDEEPGKNVAIDFGTKPKMEVK